MKIILHTYELTQCACHELVRIGERGGRALLEPPGCLDSSSGRKLSPSLPPSLPPSLARLFSLWIRRCCPAQLRQRRKERKKGTPIPRARCGQASKLSRVPTLPFANVEIKKTDKNDDWALDGYWMWISD